MHEGLGGPAFARQARVVNVSARSAATGCNNSNKQQGIISKVG